MQRSMAWGLILFSWPAGIFGESLKPANVIQFFVTPGEESPIRWTLEAGPFGGPIEYTLRDYSGKPVRSGRATTPSPGVAEVAVRGPQGFFEIEFSATQHRFGLVSLPGCKRADPFFAIDGALSWLVRDSDLREGLVQAARRSGIGMIRERLTWGAVHPAPDRWNWQAGMQFDTLRRTCARHGVEVLEMAHDAPAWMGRVGPRYPSDLVAAARSWQRIASQWQGTWGGLEIWNEPDIFFGGNLPADQYVPLVKAISCALRRPGFSVPIVGGVMAHCNRTFLDTAARNGILDSIDAFSFHTYGRAPEIEGLVEQYRAWLADHGHESMPLWLTECGRPWKTGPDRPPVDQDAESALDIAMKAVEAKACGMARYFAFVYPFYEEGQNNFGMMDRQATPLRCLAAYAQAARALAQHAYLGDLKHDEPAIRRARVFARQDAAVAVLYTGRVAPEAAVKIDLPVRRIEGIDGRELRPASPGTVPVPDGMVYIGLDRSELGDRLNPKTKAMDLSQAAAKPVPSRRRPSPIIFRYQWDQRLLEATSNGYRFRAEMPPKMPIGVRVFNLSQQAQELTVQLALSEPAVKILEPSVRRIRVPAEGVADIAWQIELPAGADARPLEVTVMGQNEAPPGRQLWFTLARKAPK